MDCKITRLDILHDTVMFRLSPCLLKTMNVDEAIIKTEKETSESSNFTNIFTETMEESSLIVNLRTQV